MRSNWALVGACLLVVANCARPQATTTGNITTAGSCSPVVVQPKGEFQIICKDPSLTRPEAIKQAQQIAELLSKLRATTQNAQELTQRLDTIIKDLEALRTASEPRRLTAQQRTAIVAALSPYRGSTIRFATNLGDSEGTRYMNDFESAVQEGLGCDAKSCDSIMAVYTQPIPGFMIVFNLDDAQKNLLPPQCTALANAIYASVTNQQQLKADRNKDIPSGSCQLIVGTK